jgi:hypothetical protein
MGSYLVERILILQGRKEKDGAIFEYRQIEFLFGIQAIA